MIWCQIPGFIPVILGKSVRKKTLCQQLQWLSLTMWHLQRKQKRPPKLYWQVMRGISWFPKIIFGVQIFTFSRAWTILDSVTGPHSWGPPRLMGVASHRSLPGGMISYTHRIHGTGKLFTSRKMKIKHLWLDKYAIHQWIHHGIWSVSNMGCQCEVCQGSSRTLTPSLEDHPRYGK